MRLIINRLSEKAVIPDKKTEQSAGLDLYACLDGGVNGVILPPHGQKIIGTGVSIMPDRQDVALMVCSNSIMALKYGITLSNGISLISSDYEGEIKVPLINGSSEPYVVRNGSPIARLAVLPIIFPDVIEKNSFIINVDTYEVRDADN